MSAGDRVQHAAAEAPGLLEQCATLSRFLSSAPGARGGRLASWARAVRWQFGYRSGATRALVEVAGTRLYVYPGSTGATGLLYVGLPEWDEMNFMLRYLRSGDHFGDVGANIGSYTLLASARHPGVRVTAVEPGEPALTRLRENLALNGLDGVGGVKVAAVAVGDQEGTVRFTRGRDTINRIALGGDGDSVEVPITTLDALFADDPPALIKVDVEGAEDRVVRGAQRLLSGERPPVLLLEWIDEVAGEFGVTGESFEARLAGHGYALATYDADTNTLTPWRTGQPARAHNRIAARDLDAVAARLREGAAFGFAPPVAVRMTLNDGASGAPKR